MFIQGLFSEDLSPSQLLPVIRQVEEPVILIPPASPEPVIHKPHIAVHLLCQTAVSCPAVPKQTTAALLFVLLIDGKSGDIPIPLTLLSSYFV